MFINWSFFLVQEFIQFFFEFGVEFEVVSDIRLRHLQARAAYMAFHVILFIVHLWFLHLEAWVDIDSVSELDWVLLSVDPRSVRPSFDLIDVDLPDESFIETGVDFRWFYFGVRNAELHLSIVEWLIFFEQEGNSHFWQILGEFVAKWEEIHVNLVLFHRRNAFYLIDQLQIDVIVVEFWWNLAFPQVSFGVGVILQHVAAQCQVEVHLVYEHYLLGLLFLELSLLFALQRYLLKLDGFDELVNCVLIVFQVKVTHGWEGQELAELENFTVFYARICLFLVKSFELVEAGL